MTSTQRFEGQSAFTVFLRTGLRFAHPAGADIEVKCNPWHDPDDGEFTFKGQGNYFSIGIQAGNSKPGSRKSSVGAGRSRALDEHDPRHAANHSIYRMEPGESLTSVAAKRQGLGLRTLRGSTAFLPMRS